MKHGKPILRPFISGGNLVTFIVIDDFKVERLNLS